MPLSSLRFLKKLNLSRNSLSVLWQLPLTLEQLDLSDNELVELEPVIPLLNRLTVLDVSCNSLESLNALRELLALKCLYANHNRLRNLQGIERLSNLVELEVQANCLRKKLDLLSLNVAGALAVVNLKGNAVVK